MTRPRPKFAISLMCMDFMHAGAQLTALNGLADAFHVDVMDGHFTNNLALSPDFVRAASQFARLPLDVHLMVDSPMDWLEAFAGHDETTLSVHAETITNNAFRVFDRIGSLGCRVGLALNPATPFEQVSGYLNRIDLLTVMTVDVGYSGARFIPEVLPKVEQAAHFKQDHGLKYTIQIDGSCNRQTYGQLARAGAEMFVLGSTGLFGISPDLDRAWQAMETDYRESLAEELGSR